MQIEAGKIYQTRDGQKVGPARREGENRWDVVGTHLAVHRDNGSYTGSNRGFDLVAEWSDGPVRTVTRKEIVPGVYGRLYVARQHASEPRILVDLADMYGARRVDSVSHGWSLDELRAAIATLTEIADALDEQANTTGDE